MNTIYIPDGSGPADPAKLTLLDQLVGEDLTTLSPREQAVLDSAMYHGECYWAKIIQSDTHREVCAVSDMGHPDSVVRLTAPRGISNRKLLLALDSAIKVLLREDLD